MSADQEEGGSYHIGKDPRDSPRVRVRGNRAREQGEVKQTMNEDRDEQTPRDSTREIEEIAREAHDDGL
jgi:hypothetical protein